MQWKNKIYQQRILLLQNLQNKEIDKFIQNINSLEDYQCHCGGKFLLQLNDIISIKDIQSALKRKDDEIEKMKADLQSQNSNQLSSEQQMKLYESIRSEIEQLVQRNQEQQIDKNLISKKMIHSHIFQKIKETLSQQSNYI